MDTGPAALAPLRGMVVDVEASEAPERLHHTIVLVSRCLDKQDRMPTAEALRVHTHVFIRRRMALEGRPVIEVTAVVEELHLDRYSQRLRRSGPPTHRGFD